MKPYSGEGRNPCFPNVTLKGVDDGREGTFFRFKNIFWTEGINKSLNIDLITKVLSTLHKVFGETTSGVLCCAVYLSTTADTPFSRD